MTGSGRVDRVGHVGSGDWLKDRRASVGHGERRGAARDRRRLRNRIRNHRFLRGGSSGNRYQHVTLGTVAWNFREVGRQACAGNIRPGTVLQRRRLEPAATEQDVIRLVGGIEEDVAAGVGDVGQVRSREGVILRLALDHQQLSRSRADINGYGLAIFVGLFQRLLRIAQRLVLIVGFGGLPNLVQRFGWRVLGFVPRAFDRRRFHPAVHQRQVVGVLGGIEEDQGACVDDLLEIVGRGAKHRRAVDQRQDCWRDAVDDPRWIVLELIGLLRRSRVRNCQRSLQKIERYGLAPRQVQDERVGVSRAVVGDGGEVLLVQGEVFQRNHAVDLVDLGARAKPDHTVVDILLFRRLHAYGGVSVQLVADPAIDLWLKHGDGRTLVADRPRPGVVGHRRRRCGGRLGCLGRRSCRRCGRLRRGRSRLRERDTRRYQGNGEYENDGDESFDDGLHGACCPPMLHL